MKGKQVDRTNGVNVENGPMALYFQQRLKRECRTALYRLASENGLTVEVSDDDEHVIEGSEGSISERLQADGSPRGFEPGYGRVEDWQQFFEHGAWLSFAFKGPAYGGDNFDPKNATEVRKLLKSLGLSGRQKAQMKDIQLTHSPHATDGKLYGITVDPLSGGKTRWYASSSEFCAAMSEGDIPDRGAENAVEVLAKQYVIYCRHPLTPRAAKLLSA